MSKAKKEKLGFAENFFLSGRYHIFLSPNFFLHYLWKLRCSNFFLFQILVKELIDYWSVRKQIPVPCVTKASGTTP
jgi:hypothetical protein